MYCPICDCWNEEFEEYCGECDSLLDSDLFDVDHDDGLSYGEEDY